MLSNECRRKIEYALEYAMLAALNQLPPPMPPARVDIEDPIPVPHDWKPCLKLPQFMLETQPNSRIVKHISKLKDLIINKSRVARNNNYLSTARSYLATATCYIQMAIAQEEKKRLWPKTKEELRATYQELLGATTKEELAETLERVRATTAKMTRAEIQELLRATTKEELAETVERVRRGDG